MTGDDLPDASPAPEKDDSGRHYAYGSPVVQAWGEFFFCMVAAATGLWLADVLADAWPLGPWQLRDVGGSREDDLCRRVQEFMVANCTHPIQLADVALEVGVSVRHLNRLYRGSYGESPGEALGRLRLEAARRLVLAEGEIPIKAVAYRCGYSSPAYFTACYRARYHETPTQSRKQGA